MTRRILLSVPPVLLIAFGLVYWTAAPGAARADRGVPPLPVPPANHIVYLIEKDAVSANTPIAPERLEVVLGAKIAHSWEKVRELDRGRPIEALIIHASTLGQVDNNWTSEAYRRGVVLAGINISVGDMADLANDRCIARDGFASEAMSGDYFVVVSSLIQGDPEDVAKIEAARTNGCSEEPASEIKGLTAVYGGRTFDEIVSTTELDIFANAVADHLIDVAEAKDEFESGKLLEPYEE